MSTDLALGGGEGCPLFGGVYTICGVEDEDGGLSAFFTAYFYYALCWELNTICGVCRYFGWVVEEVIEFILVIGGWWRRLYTL